MPSEQSYWRQTIGAWLIKVYAFSFLIFVAVHVIEFTLGNLEPHVPVFDDDYLPPLLGKHSIRLVQIQPGSQSSELRLRIQAVAFADCPVYDALSYRWQSPDTSRPIMVGDKKTQISEHLWTALRHIRHPSREKFIWVDALSIDQENDQEKSVQVPMMNQIYGRADRVLIWLGEVPFRLDEVKIFATQQWIRGREDFRKDFAENLLIPWTIPLSNWILEQDYWTRCWVVQELGLAENVHLIIINDTPHGTLAWSDLIKLLSVVRRFYTDSLQPKTPSNILAIEEYRNGRHSNVDMFYLKNLLKTFANTFCSDPRDKVFSLIGMSRDVQRPLWVDYSNAFDLLYEGVLGHFNDFLKERDQEHQLVHFATLLRRILLRQADTYSFERAKSEDVFYDRRSEWFFDQTLKDHREEYSRNLLKRSENQRNRDLVIFIIGDEILRRLCRLPGDILGFVFPDPLIERLTHVQRPFWHGDGIEESSKWSHTLRKAKSLPQNLVIRGLVSSSVLNIGPSYQRSNANPGLLDDWETTLIKKDLSFILVRLALLRQLLKRHSSMWNHAGGGFWWLHRPKIFVDMKGRVGLIDGRAQSGDVIVQYWDTSAAIVIRPAPVKHDIEGVHDGTMYLKKVIGRALILDHDKGGCWEEPSDEAIFRKNANMTVTTSLNIGELTWLSFDSMQLSSWGLLME